MDKRASSNATEDLEVVPALAVKLLHGIVSAPAVRAVRAQAPAGAEVADTERAPGVVLRLYAS